MKEDVQKPWDMDWTKYHNVPGARSADFTGNSSACYANRQ
jgi:hypothetical protein